MKTPVRCSVYMMLPVMLLLFSAANAQDDKTTAVQAMVAAKKYVFNVQSVTPMKGGARQQTPGFTLKVSADTIKADLPYFGRVYQAPVNPSDGGIKFVSTNFTYTEKPRKKGGWDITIVPKDNRDVQDIYLTISTDGYTTVNVNCTDRQPISYYGYLEAPKQ